jgi:restriction system protein
MSVPDFQTIMLPLLVIMGDGAEHSLAEVIDILGDRMGLSPEEKKELLPSESDVKFDNRVRWAAFYLRKAELLERTGRGRIRITQRGRQVLEKKPEKINVGFLRQFPEFLDFQQGTRRTVSEEDGVEGVIEETGATPEETLEASYLNLRRTLAQELLDRVKKCPPKFFERLVVDLLVSMGYGGSRKDAGQAIGQSGDEGIDGIIKEDKLGLDVVYLQAKRWEATVGRPVVQAFAGSLEGQRARKGVLITTSQFSQDAKDYVSRIEKKIILIGGEELAQLMIDHGIGVTELRTYSVRKMDLDYFDEE